VVSDQNGSKGYGFVHFESDEAAQRSIEKVNGMMLAEKKVFVGPSSRETTAYANLAKEQINF